MRAISLLAVAVLAVASCGDTGASGPGGTAAPGETVAVVAVFDGDSMLVDTGEGEREVRLAGVNAPERGECHGEEAEAWLAESAGDEVTLVAVGGDDDVDQFDRLLRDVWSDDRWLNLEAVADGHAMAIHTGRHRQDELLDATADAWERRLGMWSADACGPVPDTVEITDLVWDPPGPDGDDPTGELVTVTNEGTSAVELGGWVVRDESSQHRFVLPEGTALEPGDSVTVFSGCGDDGPAGLFWCAGDSVWSNGGDTALLLTPEGAVVDRVTYP